MNRRGAGCRLGHQAIACDCICLVWQEVLNWCSSGTLTACISQGWVDCELPTTHPALRTLHDAHLFAYISPNNQEMSHRITCYTVLQLLGIPAPVVIQARCGGDTQGCLP